MVGYLDQLQMKHQYRTRDTHQAPSIVLITTDMVPPEFYRTAPGFPHVRTPNLDRLRYSGVEFSNAFCTAPVCSPSRAAFLTGRYSYITTNAERAHDGHEAHLRNDDPIFPEYLKAHGYHTRHVGKSHIGTSAFLRAFGENANPWDRWSPPWYDDDQYLHYLRQKNLKPLQFKREIRGQAPDGNGHGNHYGGWIAGQENAPFPHEGTYPFFLVHKANESVTTYRQKNLKEPLYFQMDFFAPHQPFAIPGGMEYREAELRDQIDLASFPLATERVEPRVYSLYRKNWGLDDNDVIKDYLVANILQWEVIDRALGEFFEHLRSMDLYDESWIFFLADHGEMNCRSRLVDKGAYLNPQVLRVPLFVKAPLSSSSPSGTVCDVPVSLVDLAPTVFGITGISPSAKLDGASLLKTLQCNRREAELPVMFEIWSHVMPNPCVGQVVSTQDFGHVLYSYNACDPVDELYLLGSVDELENRVAELPELHRRAILTLHDMLHGQQRFRAYAGFLALEYSDIIATSGDLQRFVK